MSIPSRPAAKPHSTVEALEPRIAPANVTVTNTGSPTVPEDGSEDLVFTFARDGATDQPLTVYFHANGGGAANGVTTSSGPDNDFTFAAGDGVSIYTSPDKFKVTFGAGEATKSIHLTPVNDTSIEGTEHLSVTIVDHADESYFLGSPSAAAGDITDNDSATVAFVTTNHTTPEGETVVQVDVQLTTVANGVADAGTLAHDLSVNVTDLMTGTATAGADYTFNSPAQLTFAAGSSTSVKSASLTIHADSQVETNETINLGLSAATLPGGVTIGANTYTETIMENLPSVSVLNTGAASLAEDGGENFVFTFSRTGPADGDLTVNYTAGDPALFGGGVSTSDFTVVTGTDVTAFSSTSKYYNGTVTFHAGETSKTLSLHPTSDTLVEGNETIRVAVAGGNTYVQDSSGSGSANGVILDNDTATVAFTTPAHSSSEGAGTIQIGISLTTSGNGVAGQGALSHDYSVSVSDLLNGTALAGSDYSYTQQTITFSSGDTGSTKTVNLTIHDDTLQEGPETVQLGLSQPGLFVPPGPGTLISDLVILPDFGAHGVTLDSTPHIETILDNDSHIHLYAFSNSRPGGAIGKGSLPVVRIFNADTGEEQPSIMAYEKSYREGVRVAIGDINGDGNDDIITATRTGTGRIRAFDGVTHQRISFGDLNEIQAFTGKNAHGAYVALGDFYGENSLEIIVGSGLGGGQVKIFSSEDGTLQGTKTPFAPSYKGGIRVAAGDLNFDGRADIVAGMGQYGSMVKIIASGEAPDVLFQAGPKKLRDGVFVAVGDVSPSGPNEIIVGRGKAGNPDHASIGVFSFFGRETLSKDFGPTEIETIPLNDSVYQFGARVALADLNADGVAEIIAGAGPLGGSKVQFFDGDTYAELTAKATTAFPTMPKLGVFVAGHVELAFSGVS